MIPIARNVLLLAVIVLLQSATVCLKSQEVEYLMSSSIGDDDDDAASVDVHYGPHLPRPKRKATRIGLSVEKKIDIIKMHNRCRRESDPPATNMQILEWEEELADIAQCHAQRCRFEHNTKERRELHSSKAWIAQNMGMVNADYSAMNVSGHVRGWFNERNDYNFTSKECSKTKICGHYTALMWPTTRWVGCGVAECRPLEYPRVKRIYDVGTMLVCNYLPGGNVRSDNPDDKLYKTGGEACSSCDAGQSCDNGLCKTPGCKGTTCKSGVELLKEECVCNSNANPVCPATGSGSGTKKLALDKMIFTASTLATVLLLRICF